MADFLPRAQAELVTWATNFLSYLTANQAALGLTATEVVALQTQLSTASTAFRSDQSIQAQALASTKTLNMALEGLETSIRELNSKLQANPAVTDAQKAAMRLTVAKERSIIPAPTTPPGVISIEPGGPLTLTVHFGNVTGTEIKRGRPDGATACQVYVHTGTTPPASPAECVFLAIDTRTPYEAQFTAANAGKLAYFYLRWMNAKGEVGPWSSLAQATIPA
jgi:TolA-binding protein